MNEENLKQKVEKIGLKSRQFGWAQVICVPLLLLVSSGEAVTVPLAIFYVAFGVIFIYLGKHIEELKNPKKNAIAALILSILSIGSIIGFIFLIYLIVNISKVAKYEKLKKAQ